MVEMMSCIIVLLLVGYAVWFWFSVVDFIVETPKQLKRIADALEWRNKHGK